MDKADLSLDRIRLLLNRLGHPQRHIPPVFHVAGTNGKGSTIAIIQSLLHHMGYRTHRYISPHLMNINERIMVKDQYVDDESLHEALSIVDCYAPSGTTFFEKITAAAFILFHEIPADFVLLETGLGGRLDATNVIDRPLCSIITPISLDHQDYLGATLSLIAREKKGILKPHGLSVIAKQQDDIMHMFHECDMVYGRDFYCDPPMTRMKGLPDPIDQRHLSLKGVHQHINTSTALAALHVTGLLPNQTIIDQSLSDVYWPGRLQMINGWLIDGAHNMAGFEVLQQFLKDSDKIPFPVIFAMKKDKDLSCLSLIKNYIHTLYFVELGDDFYKIADLKEIFSFPIVKTHLQEAQSLCQNSDHKGLVCGSLYLIGPIMSALLP